jgi:hypothetical protein
MTSYYPSQIDHFRKFRPTTFIGPFKIEQAGLSNIMTDDLAVQYNWGGVKNNRALKDLYLFKTVLYGKHFHDIRVDL